MIKKRGFTLIELLVVISILGVLATLVLVSFTGTQKQARDTQRKSDLRQYQNALEAFANRNNSLYPSRTGTAQASTTLCTDLTLTTCPEDPRNGDDATFIYNYQSNGGNLGAVPADGTKYVLWGKLENSTDYWVVCSNGKVGAKAQSGFSVSGGDCPL